MNQSRGQRLSKSRFPSFLHVPLIFLAEANRDVTEELPKTFEDSDQHRERQCDGE